MSRTIRVISLWQPWATLFVIGAKTMETRSWSTRFVGDLAIHASMKRTGELRSLCFKNPFFNTLRIAGYDNFDALPRGGIVGTVEITNCLGVDSAVVQRRLIDNPDEKHFGDYSAGRFAWIAKRPCEFEEVVPEVGKQGFWNISIDRLPRPELYEIPSISELEAELDAKPEARR